MSQKEKWYTGWWTIPLILMLVLIAWKAYPFIISSDLMKKMRPT